MKLVCALACYTIFVHHRCLHVCIRDEMWSPKPEVTSIVNDKSLDKYLSTDDNPPIHGAGLPSTGKAPAFDTHNDDLLSLGSGLSDTQGTDIAVELHNLIATNDNAHCYITE